MKLGTQVLRVPGHIVSDEDPAPLPKGAHTPTFRPISVMSKMAGWIKMPLGREVGLGQSHIVLDGDPASPPQNDGRALPIFGPCIL